MKSYYKCKYCDEIICSGQNKEGKLTSHIKKNHLDNIDIKLKQKHTGKFFLQYFDHIDEDELKTNECKICSNPIFPSNIYCSNKCKFSDNEYNKKRGIKPTINDESKKLVCKLCKKEFKDINNQSGNLTKHLKNKHNILQFSFDYYIIKNDDKEYIRCKLCNKRFYDLNNNSGALTLHINNFHNITIDEYCNKFQNQKYLWKTYFEKNKENKQREQLFLNSDNYVICQICKKKFKKLTNKHLKTHNITLSEYKSQYNILNVNSKMTSKIQSSKNILDKIDDIFFGNRLGNNIEPCFPINEYKGVSRLNSYKFRCTICKHKFFDNLADGRIPICRSCNPKKDFKVNGKLQKSIYSFIKESCNVDIVLYNDRTLLDGYELDIVIPKFKSAIEVDGLYWHSELNGKKDSNYHLNKTIQCKNIGYRLIHIFEDEWNNKQEIVKSRLKTILNTNNNVIYARKCIIKEIYNNTKNKFLNDNHIQGKDISKIRLGAFYDNEIVSVMTFSKKRLALGNKNINDNEYELIRFCVKNNYRVVGIASKLFKYFLRRYNPKEVLSYADRRWSNGNLYEKLGFKFIGYTRPNYWYIHNDKRIHRFNFRKSILIKKGYDSKLSEWEIMQLNNIDRIWDCGNYKFIYNC